MNKFNYLICGESAAGKDQSALYMPGYIRKAFGDNIRDTIKLLYLCGVDETFDYLTKLFITPPDGLKNYLTELKQKYKYDPEGKNKVILQDIGTYCRNHDDMIWVRSVNFNSNHNYVITDCRRIAEFKAFPRWKSIYIDCSYEIRKERIIQRDKCWNKEWDNHIAESEIRLLRDLCDYTVFNDSTLESLEENIKAILKFDTEIGNTIYD